MTENKNRDDELREILKQRGTIKASKEAHEKSLAAFKVGIEDVVQTKRVKKNKKKLFRFSVPVLTTFIAAGIAAILLLSFEPRNDELPGDSIQRFPKEENEKLDREETDTTKNIDFSLIDVDAEVLETVFSRPMFDEGDNLIRGDNLTRETIYNSKYVIPLPRQWTFSEENGEEMHKVQLEGRNSELIQLTFFEPEVDDQFILDTLDVAVSNWEPTGMTKVEPEQLLNHLSNQLYSIFTHEEILPFRMDTTKMYAFISEENNRFMEVYLTELWGDRLLFTAEYPLDNKESWSTSWQLFTDIRMGDFPFMYTEEEVEYHPIYKRPLVQKALQEVGVYAIYEIEAELYENEELELTSYIPSGTEVVQVDNEYFKEWRFYDRNLSELSYYSFGKLKDGFPLDNAFELMFDLHDLKAEHYESEMDIPFNFPYYTGGVESNIFGHIVLFETEEDGWYFSHLQENYQDYNGGYLRGRLELLLQEMEWH